MGITVPVPKFPRGSPDPHRSASGAVHADWALQGEPELKRGWCRDPKHLYEGERTGPGTHSEEGPREDTAGRWRRHQACPCRALGCRHPGRREESLLSHPARGARLRCPSPHVVGPHVFPQQPVQHLLGRVGGPDHSPGPLTSSPWSTELGPIRPTSRLSPELQGPSGLTPGDPAPQNPPRTPSPSPRGSGALQGPSTHPPATHTPCLAALLPGSAKGRQRVQRTPRAFRGQGAGPSLERGLGRAGGHRKELEWVSRGGSLPGGADPGQKRERASRKPRQVEDGQRRRRLSSWPSDSHSGDAQPGSTWRRQHSPIRVFRHWPEAVSQMRLQRKTSSRFVCTSPASGPTAWGPWQTNTWGRTPELSSDFLNCSASSFIGQLPSPGARVGMGTCSTPGSRVTGMWGTRGTPGTEAVAQGTGSLTGFLAQTSQVAQKRVWFSQTPRLAQGTFRTSLQLRRVPGAAAPEHTGQLQRVRDCRPPVPSSAADARIPAPAPR